MLGADFWTLPPIGDRFNPLKDSAQIRSKGKIPRIKDGARRCVPSITLLSELAQFNAGIQQLWEFGMNRHDGD
jgi:hypothetical protein